MDSSMYRIICIVRVQEAYLARLRRSVLDGHLFILAGQSQGTWQVGEKGEQWLRQNHYPIPAEYEDVVIDAGTFSYLKDRDYLFIHGNDYDHNGWDAIEQELVRVFRGLPMILRLKERQDSAWELYLDLSELNEAVWDELQSHHTDLITATNALPVSRRLIFYADGMLRIYPFPHPYQIFSSNSDNSKQLLQQAPETPGLNDNWQGNIFLERATQAGAWQRRVPNTTVSFSGGLLWLAKPACNLDWPGQAEKIGNTQIGWQLWRLTVSENVPTSWESIQNWFKYRSIDVVPFRQRLEIVSLPSVVTEDGQYTIEPGKSIWIACHPPTRQTQGIFREIALSAEQIALTTSSSNPPSKYISASSPADRINYFRWSADQPADYRIRIQGDASAEPLHIKVASLPNIQPAWLRGLSCTVTTDEDQQTLYAFNDIDDSGNVPFIMDQLTQEELARLDWTYEPAGLPVSITWFSTTSGSQQRPGNVYFAQSAEELTWYWNEKICPALTLDSQVKLVLDANSFGSITLTIAVPQQQEAEVALPLEQQVEAMLPQQEIADSELPEEPEQVEIIFWINERLSAQFAWLSRIIAGKYGQKSLPTPMPERLRERLLELSTQSNVTPSLGSALEKLASAHLIPAWVLFRLQTLTAEVENIEQNSPQED